ncbi:MAG: L-threonylcarbamoyladenylate synthase [Candidatus Nanoarchaeia archaeon]
MEIVTKEELGASKRKYLKLMKSKVFIYPTDTIYGIGCDATNIDLVAKIRKLKKSNLQPFSIIVPSKEWVYKNCIVDERQKSFVEALGGKLTIAGKKTCFTIILKLKNDKAIAKNVNQGCGTIGVRLPDHWFADYVKELGVPIITTSANPTGENFMTTIDDLHESIQNSVDFVIYEGPKKGFPSTIIHTHEEAMKIKERGK